MLELYLTAQIIFTLNAGLSPICKDLGYPILDGCYDGINKIYISEITSRPKDFILYHEVGHALFNQDFFADKTQFKNVETLAENFALYVYQYKYHNVFIKTTKKNQKYFATKCDKKCVEEIINVKVPQMVYPIKPFDVRI